MSENLASETILYDKTSHRAHSLTKTVARVWELADGEKSIEELTAILQSEFGVPADRNLVVLALEELKAAELLECEEEPAIAEAAVSRRDVARKLMRAGVAAGSLPFVTSVLAPTPAMASSSISQKQAAADLKQVTFEALSDPAYYSGPHAKKAQKDLADAMQDFKTGEYTDEVKDLAGVLKALGLPPLP